LATPLKKMTRHEDNADAQSRDERRDGNLLCAVENRVNDGLALAQIAMDILDFDRGIIDQNPDGQR